MWLGVLTAHGWSVVAMMGAYISGIARMAPDKGKALDGRK
jgi:hypothetical protein